MKSRKVKSKESRIRFCPKCKSTDVEKEILITTIFGLPQKWKCNNCGFKGHLFPEKILNSKKLNKKAK